MKSGTSQEFNVDLLKLNLKILEIWFRVVIYKILEICSRIVVYKNSHNSLRIDMLLVK